MLNRVRHIAFVATFGLFAPHAHAERAVVTLNINNLKAAFEATGESGKYRMSEAQVDCKMTVQAEGETQELDCSQQVSVSEGAFLEVKASGKQVEATMISEGENGEEKRDVLRGQLIGQLKSISGGAATYKMNLSDVIKKFKMEVSDEGVRAKISIKVQGSGSITVSDQKAFLLFPNITLKIDAKAN